MKKMVLWQVIGGVLLTVSWGAEPPNEPPNDDKVRCYVFLLTNNDLLYDPDYEPSEHSSDDEAYVDREYSTRSRKRQAEQPPAEEDVPVAKRHKIELEGIPFPDAIYQEL